MRGVNYYLPKELAQTLSLNSSEIIIFDSSDR
jgi:hypothetical protein